MMPLWDRLVVASGTLQPVASDLRCIYEDPAFPDRPARVLIPAAEWMACARHGGILPPIDAYLTLPLRLTFAAGRSVDCTEIEAQEFRVLETVVREQVLPQHTLNTAHPVKPMTEAEAMEYLVMKDVPFRVWGRQHNRPMFRIVSVAQLPADRAHRNAWKLSEMAA